ncbi:MAG: cytochrome D1 [Acidobacteria bacterium]|nr:MAG: cytochrome D1 [Acidobacteriota bacterium]
MLLPALAALATTGDPAPDELRVVRQGIAVEVELENLAPGRDAGELREGDPVRFRFTITDTASGTPLSSVYPAAWMDLKPAAEKVDDACQTKIEAFIGGSLLTPPELDLNVYYVLALNDDPSITVVDPLFGFGNTKLLAMITLDSPGEDWALTNDQEHLFVALPASDRLAVAATSSWEVVDELAVGPQPTRLALQRDQRFLWVGHDRPAAGAEASGVTVIDVQSLAVAGEVETGRGHHDLALSDDDRWLFVTNRDDGTLSVIDVRTRRKVADVPVGTKPISVAYSSLARAAYAVDEAGAITVVDGTSHEVVARLETEPGLGQIRFAPGGRLGFVVHPQADALHIVDAAKNRIIQTADVGDEPDQLAFSDELAYVRHGRSETVLMIPLDQVGQEGQPVPVVDFPGGQRPFGDGPPSPADSIVQAPGATAVLVANPADRAIYYYKEGMAAPMGHFQNYGHRPRAVAVVDRSLQEREPGVYETTALLRSPGEYDLAFFLDTPRLTHCFPVRVKPNPELAAAREAALPARLEAVEVPRTLRAGDTAKLRFRLVAPRTGEGLRGLEDVNVLSFLAPGRDQRRQWAEEVGDGVYEVDFTPRRAGVYFVFVQCESLGLAYQRSPYQVIEVKPAGDAAGG